MTDPTTGQPSQPSSGSQAAPESPGRLPGPRRFASPRVLAAALGVLAVALASCSVYFAVATHRDATAQAGRQDVLDAARAEAVNLTSQDYSTIDRDLDRMIGGTTGDLRTDLGKQRDRYRTTFVQNKLRAQGSATEAGLVTMRDRAATVLVVIDQVVRTGTKNAQVQPRHYRLELDMSHVNGKWLASGLRAAGLVS